MTALVRCGRRSWAIRPILYWPTGTRPCGPVDVGVQPGAGLELQDLARLVERPDPGEGAVEVADGRLGAAAEHLAQRRRPGQGEADVAAELGEPGLLGDGLLGAPSAR